MINLPYILFDQNSDIIYSTVLHSKNLRETFLRSMRRSDRIRFIEFCASPFDPAASRYCFYQISGFPGAEYVFIEKDTLRTEEITIAYFAADQSDFYQLMSPSSAFYRDVTGTCIAGILSPESSANLTPEGYLTIDSIPHLRDELAAEENTVGFCSIRRLAEEIISSLSRVPSFSRINLTSDADESELILPIPLCSYVFLFTALLCIFNTLAENHNINITLTRRSTDFLISVSQARAKEIDSGSLDSLIELSPSTGNLAKISTAIAYRSGLDTSVICSGTSLSAVVAIRETEIEEPHFHFRDPYTEIPAMVGEYLGFIGQLFSSSGYEAQGENQNLGTQSVG